MDAPFEDGSLVFTEGYKPPSYEGLQEATIRAQMNQPTSIFMECNWWIFVAFAQMTRIISVSTSPTFATRPPVSSSDSQTE